VKPGSGPDSVRLLPDGVPLFRGASTACRSLETIPGYDVAESATFVFANGGAEDWLQGDVQVELLFVERPIVNGPGPDLAVFEAQNREEVRLAVHDSSLAAFTKYRTILVEFSGVTTSVCGSANVNVALIELDDFGIAPGARVGQVRIDNRGAPGFEGADIMGLHALNQVGDDGSGSSD
jgi:hypothetical protein